MNLADLYRDLAERMLHAAAEVKARAVTKDEDKGHEFHGNQWTGGLGAKPKPTSVKSKTAKAAVHELLSSGHTFTKQELMDIAGVKTEKLFSDYMAMLKNPKYAGPAGALQIMSKNGHYYVAMPDGTQAPAPPKDTFIMDPALDPEFKKPKGLPPHLQAAVAKYEEGQAKQAAAMGKPSHTITEVHVPGITEEGPAVPKPTKAEKVAAAAPAPTPSPTPAQTPADPDAAAMAALFKEPTSPYATAVTALSGAQPGSMPKGEADKHYEQAMAAANVYMAHGVKTGDVNKGHEAVLKWKKQKAAAMAAWAQAVHGKTVMPAAQQIYKADEQLATDIAQGKAMSVAIAEWKTNTGLEKSGLFPAPKEPKGATPAQVMQMAKAGGADMGHPEHVQPHEYASLVPAHHTHIGPGDFATPQGEWYKGILKFKNDLESQSAVNAQSNKKSVEHKLRERLKDKPNFQALVKRLGLSKEGPGSLESRLIQTWAGSSGDGNALSVSMQLAVRDAFGIPDSHIEKKALSALHAHSNETELFKAAVHGINPNINPLQSHEIETAKHALREFVQAQYAETQQLLKEQGHDHVYLARGHAHEDGAQQRERRGERQAAAGVILQHELRHGQPVRQRRHGVPRQGPACSRS
jgi:hypothetical protein